MNGFKEPGFTKMTFSILLTVLAIQSPGEIVRAEPPAEKPEPVQMSVGFHPNHRVTDASRRSFWAHTFSSGAHSVAVHGKEVYVVWYDVRNGDSDVFFGKSTDNGSSFGANTRINDDSGKAKQYKPSLGMDSAGGLYVLWRDDRRGHADIYFAHSEDGGKTFSKNLLLNDDRGWAYQGNPTIGVSSDGAVYAAWSDDRNGQSDIYFSVSRDRGKTFGRNVKLNDDAGRAVQSHPTVGAGPGGLVIVAWEDFRNGRSEVYLARSTDGGKTFEPNRRVVSGADGSIQVSPSIAASPDGRVALAWSRFKPQAGPMEPPDAAKGETLWWAKVRQGDADIEWVVSADGGAHFGSPTFVNDDRSGRAQAFPSIAIDPRGGVELAWEDFRNGQADIYFARIGPGQVGMTPNQKVNDDAAGALHYHPSLAVDEQGRAYLVWTDGRGNPFVSPADAKASAFEEEEGNDIYFSRSK